MLPLPSPPQDTMDDSHIRGIDDLSLKLKNLGPEQLKTICQRRQQLNNRPVLEREVVGLGEGSRGGRVTLDSASALPPLTRWKSCQGNLLQYQQQLEGALEIHTLSGELDDLTERIGEKVSSSLGARSSGVSMCLTLGPLSSSAWATRG